MFQNVCKVGKHFQCFHTEVIFTIQKGWSQYHYENHEFKLSGIFAAKLQKMYLNLC